MKFFLFSVIFLAAAGALGWYFFLSPETTPAPSLTREPMNFVECAALYPVRGGSPRTCTTHLGIMYSEYLGNTEEMKDRIVIFSLQPNDVISSPLSVSGKARGAWYNSDGEILVEVQDASGNMLGKGKAEAQRPWLTESFVSFKTILTFTLPSFDSTGTLIFKPSQKSENPLTIPVKFK